MANTRYTFALLGIGVALCTGGFATVLGQRGGVPQAPVLRTAIYDAQQKIYYADANDRTIRALPIRDNIWMIVGAGGNITVQTGDDGVLAADTGSISATAEKVSTILRAL